MLAYIGLGSNLDNPKKQINNALIALNNEPNINIIKTSSLYQSNALTLDNISQPDYINAVTKINTSLTALKLLNVCQKIETQQHRVRNKKWGARTIDLDIIIYDNKVMNSKTLTIPHIEMANRHFVLVPLYEIEPNLIVPKLGSIKKLVANISSKNLTRL